MRKRLAGRPKKNPQVAKNVHISVRLSPEEYEKLYYICRNTGKSGSDILREGLNFMFYKTYHD